MNLYRSDSLQQNLLRKCHCQELISVKNTEVKFHLSLDLFIVKTQYSDHSRPCSLPVGRFLFIPKIFLRVLSAIL